MPILIVSGNCEAGVAEVFRLLARAGVTDARPSLRDNLSPVDLSATLIGTQAKPSRQSAPISLEALTRWRSHACEIVAANEQVNCWGWADQNLLSALEFWFEVIPGAKFVLVYSSPECALANLKNAPENLDIWLSEWISRSEEMVRVACKFPESVTLVGAAGAIRHPVGLLEALGIAPEHPSGQATETSFLAGPSALSLLLAQLCLGRTREIKSLVAELESLASITAGGEPLVADRPKAWAEYRNLVENARHVVRHKAELAALTQRRDEQSQLASERANQIASLIKTRDDHITEVAQLKRLCDERAQAEQELKDQLRESQQELGRIPSLMAKIEEQTFALDASLQENTRLNEKASAAAQMRVGIERQLADAAAENARIGTALRVAQEALEALQTSASEIAAARDEQANLNLSLLSEREELTRLVAQRSEEIDTLKAEGRDLLSQLHLTQEELEAHFLQIKAATRLCDEQVELVGQQAAELVALAQARDEQARRIAELLTQQGEQSKISATLSAQVESLKSEGDQLLFQLHQTQEELEDFFLKFKANEASRSPRLSVVDFRSEVNGSNWFHPEVDGRWAGPSLESTVLIPALPSGQYELMLDVVDTIAPHVLEQMEIWMNDTSLPLEHYGDGRAAVVKTQFRAAHSAAGDIWKIRLKFPVAMSPADEGSDDQRHLTIRARSLVVLGLD